jgi:hypothetical protein
VKYKPSPLNILAALVVLKYIVNFIRGLNAASHNDTEIFKILFFLMQFFIPALFIGMDILIQHEQKGKKYLRVLIIEMAIIIVLALVVYFGYNFRSVYALTHNSIFDGIK